MGTPQINQGAEKTRDKANAHALAVLPAIDAAFESGVAGLAEIANWLNINGVPTTRGSVWRNETVRRVLNRLARLGCPSLASRSCSAGQSGRWKSPRLREEARKARMARRRAELEAAAKQ